MIKTKNLVILGVALVVLFGINMMQKSGHRTATNQSSVTVVIPGPIAADDLQSITLGYGDEAESVVLDHTPTGWVVASAWGAEADATRIEALVRNLQGLTGEYRSDNGEVLADYGLADNNAVHIRATGSGNEPGFGLEVGRKPERYPGNFVRLPDENRVYVSQKNLLAQLGLYGEPQAPENRYFLQLQAVKEDRLQVDQVSITDGHTLTLVKKFAVEEPDSAGAEPSLDRNTWEWELAGGKKASLAKTKVDAVLNSLVAIRATDVVDPTADLATYGLDNPSRHAELKLADGGIVSLDFGADREATEGVPAGTYLKVGDKPTVWVATEYAIKNIFKSLDELKP